MPNKQALAVVLSFLLLASPLWSSPGDHGTSAALQVVHVREAMCKAPALSLSGDLDAVGRDGSSKLRIPGGTEAQFGKSKPAFAARLLDAVKPEISKGDTSFRSLPNAAFISTSVITPFVTERIRLTPPQSTLPQNNVPLFLDHKSDWIQAAGYDGADLAIHPGGGIRASIASARTVRLAPPQSNALAPHKKNRRKWVTILIGAAGIAAATGIALAVGSGEGSVTSQQKQSATSPVVP